MARAYNVAEARKEFSAILNLAEGGETVIIERSGSRFRLSREPAVSKAAKTSSYFEVLDPKLNDGEWDWRTGESGLELVPREQSQTRGISPGVKPTSRVRKSPSQKRK